MTGSVLLEEDAFFMSYEVLMHRLGRGGLGLPGVIGLAESIMFRI